MVLININLLAVGIVGMINEMIGVDDRWALEGEKTLTRKLLPSFKFTSFSSRQVQADTRFTGQKLKRMFVLYMPVYFEGDDLRRYVESSYSKANYM